MSVDIFRAKKDETIIEVATRIVLDLFNGIPIINDDRQVIGIITSIDILRAMKDEKDLNNTTIEEIMTVNPTVINQKDIDETIGVMDKNGIFMIPLVQDDRRRMGICPRAESKRIGQHLIIFS